MIYLNRELVIDSQINFMLLFTYTCKVIRVTFNGLNGLHSF